MKLPIPQAMAWKYGAKCSKTLDGQDIAAWEHPTEPQPSSAQVLLDVAEYENYVSGGGLLDAQNEAKFNQDIIKAVGLTMKDFMNEIMGGRIDPITNGELKTKFKSYL